ncbi:MAG: Inner membrane protein [Chlamydiae bacterium]|nr:Inner membrane protein [Chlamydiota bacterium]
MLEWIQNHAEHAHWILFGAALLAGMNIPISIDLLMILAATLAATLVSTNVLTLFFAMFFGCLFSAWIAYWIGRKLGPKLLKFPLFSKMLNEKRIEKMKVFYEKRGPMAYILGRFIPFGVRNALFMTSGISRIPFAKFALYDTIGCVLWSCSSFFLYYLLGKNIDALYSQVKSVNLLIFIAFSVTGIGLIWYKKKKNVKEENV